MRTSVRFVYNVMIFLFFTNGKEELLFLRCSSRVCRVKLHAGSRSGFLKIG